VEFLIDKTDYEQVKTVEYAPIGIWKLNAALTIEEANRAVSVQLGGASREDLVGKNVLDILPFLRQELFDSVHNSGRSFNHHMCTQHDAGKLMPTYWEVTIGPVMKGDSVTGFVMSTLEVTERERLLQQREDFVAALVHNLKTPLVGADRTLESLLNGALGQLAEEQAAVLAKLKRSNMHLLDMVQDLIDVYRYETNSANLQFEKIDLNTLAQTCIELLGPACREREVKIKSTLKNLPPITADRSAMKRLLCNLLDTCLHYTPAQGLIQIEGQLTGDGFIAITVRDNGVGMGLEDPEALFMRFDQGVPGKRYPPTAGLGLYLARQIATAHGGTISVSSVTDVGTTFSIRLPLTR
jgi:signal transduction histidine kinase